jgi:hypothetical protein
MKKGQAYLFNAPPGWLFTGIFNEEKDGRLCFDSVVWVDQVKEPVFNLCLEDNTERADKIVTRGSQILGFDVGPTSLTFTAEIPVASALKLFEAASARA